MRSLNTVNVKRGISLIITMLFMFTILSITVLASVQDAPVVPAFFYGNAELNGEPVAVDSVIYAWIDNEARGSITVETAGLYGESDGNNKLAVVGGPSDIGKEVSFSIKVPSYYEINSSNTSEWSFGTVTNFSLEFSGELVALPQDSEDDGDDSGSSSGDSSSSGGAYDPNAQTTKRTFSYSTVPANNQVAFSLSSLNAGFTQFQMVLIQEVSDVVMSFEVVDNPGSAPKIGNVYNYLSIDAPKITEDVIDLAIIKFKLPLEWFESNNYDPESVKLMRYHDGEWMTLQTIYEGGDSYGHQYRAVVPGFSYFAIQADEKSGSTAPDTSDDQQVLDDGSADQDDGNKEDQAKESSLEFKDGENDNSNFLTGLVSGSDSKPNPLVGTAVFFAIVIIGLLVYNYGFKRD